MSDDEILERLDLIAATLRLAFDDAITAKRVVIRGDAASAALLDLTTDDWVASGTLKRTVVERAKIKERTVSRRIAELVAAGALSQRGSGSQVAYRSTGLI
jgi:hypothetical protein